MRHSHLWMDFQDTIRLWWLQKIWRRLPSLHHREHIATRSCHLALRMLMLLTTSNHHFTAWLDPQRSKSLCWWYDSKVQRLWRAHPGFEEVLWKNLVLQVVVESKEVYFWSHIQKIVRVYGKLEGNRSWSWQNQGNCRNEASKNWKGDLRIFGENTVHQQVHSPTHYDMWTNLPTALERSPYSVEQTMPWSLWKDQELSNETTNTCPTSSWKAIVVVSHYYRYSNEGPPCLISRRD